MCWTAIAIIVSWAGDEGREIYIHNSLHLAYAYISIYLYIFTLNDVGQWILFILNWLLWLSLFYQRLAYIYILYLILLMYNSGTALFLCSITMFFCAQLFFWSLLIRTICRIIPRKLGWIQRMNYFMCIF